MFASTPLLLAAAIAGALLLLLRRSALSVLDRISRRLLRHVAACGGLATDSASCRCSR